MNKKVLLIQPRHGIWDGVFIRFPESVLSIAALPYANGYDVTIIDIRVENSWKQKLIKQTQEEPICIGITSLTGPSLEYVIEAIEIIKSVNQEIPIILGGVHATLLPEQSLNTSDVDIIVKGDADFIFYDLIKVLEKEKDLNKIIEDEKLNSVKGLYYKNSQEKIVYTGMPEWVNDFDKLPDTPYKLLDIKKYNAADLGNGVSASFQTSRGCPFACKFCGNEILQKRDMRHMSVSQLVKKIKFLQREYGFNSFVFVDDLTIAGRKHFVEFTQALSEIRPTIRWTSTGIRANLISKLNEADLQLLWDSGCRSLDIGIETGSERILKYIKKADSKENMLYSNRLLAKFDFKVKYTFIVGYPTETDEEINETLDFLLELQEENKNIYPMVFVFLPIVGTALYEDVVESGFQEPQKLQEWIDVDSTSWFYKCGSWIPEKRRRHLETIMIASPFCSKNAKTKFTTLFGKISFVLYHPIAKFRFKYKIFSFPFESYLLHLTKK